jgi:hypothetical protein
MRSKAQGTVQVTSRVQRSFQSIFTDNGTLIWTVNNVECGGISTFARSSRQTALLTLSFAIQLLLDCFAPPPTNCSRDTLYIRYIACGAFVIQAATRKENLEQP